MKTSSAILLFEDGTSFEGKSIGADGTKTGEVVFNTSMTGYQEILTDPSYHSQIINFTNPHIGNTGINDFDQESNKIHASGLIIRDSEISASNWRMNGTLSEFLIKNNIVGMSNVDTRKITKLLRDKGSLNACMMCNDSLSLESIKSKLNKFPGLIGADLAKEVTTESVYEWKDGKFDLYNESLNAPPQEFNIVVYDFGVKQNILRILKDLGCNIKVVPADYSVQEVMLCKPDGIFLSNGPGDPEACQYAISNIRSILEKKIPMFGICLGFQLLGLAAGAKTKKMKFGHHGANHPVIDLTNKRVLITSQNHGFMIDEKSLPPEVKLTHRSLFDDSLQGLELPSSLAYGFQGHPEASPGPHDIHHVFEKFLKYMRANKNA